MTEIEKHENDVIFQRHYNEWNDEQRATILGLDDDEFYSYVADLECADYQIKELEKTLDQIHVETSKIFNPVTLTFADETIDNETRRYYCQLCEAFHAYFVRLRNWRQYLTETLDRY